MRCWFSCTIESNDSCGMPRAVAPVTMAIELAEALIRLVTMDGSPEQGFTTVTTIPPKLPVRASYMAMPIDARGHFHITFGALKNWFIAQCYDSVAVAAMWLIALLILHVPFAFF